MEDWNPFYDVRRYPKMTWLSTIIIGKDRVLSELEGYMRLQDYFFGLNDRGAQLRQIITDVRVNSTEVRSSGK